MDTKNNLILEAANAVAAALAANGPDSGVTVAAREALAVAYAKTWQENIDPVSRRALVHIAAAMKVHAAYTGYQLSGTDVLCALTEKSAPLLDKYAADLRTMLETPGKAPRAHLTLVITNDPKEI